MTFAFYPNPSCSSQYGGHQRALAFPTRFGNFTFFPIAIPITLHYNLLNGEVLMQSQVRFVCMLISFLLVCATSLACPQRGSIPSDFQTTVTQPAKLKASRMPSASYPREAFKKGIEGTIVLFIVVNAEGKVSEAKVRSGPPELAQAALDSAKLWESAAVSAATKAM